MNWKDREKIAVVTGSAGIGLGIALKLVEEGFGVVLCGNSEDDNATARNVSKKKPIEVVDLDVSDETAVKVFTTNLGKDIKGLDALINCAAIQPYGNIETTTPEAWRNVIDINLTGYFLMAHFLYPLLKSRHTASIINISSVQGHLNQSNVLGYATSKGAIHAFTRALAVDCARDNIRVNSISPGSIRTPLLEFAAKELTEPGGNVEDTLIGFGEAHAIKRIGTVEEIGALVAYLVGPDAGFCIGSDFLIDGGLKAKLGV
jgi:NAD(P)-dependent dehydrogenase (short-subunit alcohol dehydrogenase family)|tara:strand:- start:1197 stop:1976 length:780 start_codon:yes stop_codon:yes gene_type:complete